MIHPCARRGRRVSSGSGSELGYGHEFDKLPSSRSRKMKRSDSRRGDLGASRSASTTRRATTCRRASASDRARGRRRDRLVRSARTGRATEGTCASNARGRGSASTGGCETAARSAGARASASTGACDTGASECGGSGICEHGRRRNTCKECGGGSICDHGRMRSKCKECGGRKYLRAREAAIQLQGVRGLGHLPRARATQVQGLPRGSRRRPLERSPPFRLKPDAKVVPAIKREPSDTSDPGVDPDAAEAPEIKSEPSELSDPGSVDSRLDRA